MVPVRGRYCGLNLLWAEGAVGRTRGSCQIWSVEEPSQPPHSSIAATMQLLERIDSLAYIRNLLQINWSVDVNIRHVFLSCEQHSRATFASYRVAPPMICAKKERLPDMRRRVMEHVFSTPLDHLLASSSIFGITPCLGTPFSVIPSVVKQRSLTYSCIVLVLRMAIAMSIRLLALSLHILSLRGTCRSAHLAAVPCQANGSTTYYG
jgi:hypothetical protein